MLEEIFPLLIEILIGDGAIDFVVPEEAIPAGGNEALRAMGVLVVDYL